MSVDDLARRLATLEAREAIKELKYRYWRACDDRDVEAFRGCFVRHGADIDFEGMGHFDDADGITTVFRRVALARQDDGQPVVLDMHHGTHPEIALVDDTHATGRWTLRFRQLDLVGGTERIAAVEYNDAYVVEDGQWRVSRSHARTLWSLSRPLGDDVTVTEGRA